MRSRVVVVVRADTERSERGGVSVIVAVMVGVLAVLMMLLLNTGWLLIVQQEVQNSADALALAGAAALRERGGSAGDVLDISGIASFVHSKHSRVPARARFTVTHDDPSARAIVRVEVTAEVKNPYRIGRDTFVVRRTAAADVSEWGFAKSKWPAVVILLDASGSMGTPIRSMPRGSQSSSSPPPKRPNYYDLPGVVQPGQRSKVFRPPVIHRGGSGEYAGPCIDPQYHCLYELLTDLVKEYAAKPFPARNGLVVFNKKREQVVRPPSNNIRNIGAIRAAFDAVKPNGRTDIRGPLEEAATMIEGPADSVIIITDGDVNEGGTDWAYILPWLDTDKEAALKAATELRSSKTGMSANLFTIETRARGNKRSELLTAMAGGPGTEGGDEKFYYKLGGLKDIPAFLAAMSRRVCSFGPLPDTKPDDTRPDIKSSRQQVYAFIREPNGSEEPLEYVNARQIETTPGEGYGVLQTDAGDYVQLTPDACYRLARAEGRQIVIRWGGVSLFPEKKLQQLMHPR